MLFLSLLGYIHVKFHVNVERTQSTITGSLHVSTAFSLFSMCLLSSLLHLGEGYGGCILFVFFSPCSLRSPPGCTSVKYVSDLQATSCSCRAATGQQRVTMPGWWAPTCHQLKAPVWNSGPTGSPHVRKPAATTWWLELDAVIFDLRPNSSAADCKLNVWRLSDGKVHQLLAIRDLQEPWVRYSVDIESTEEYQVPFWHHQWHCSCFNWLPGVLFHMVWPLLSPDCVGGDQRHRGLHWPGRYPVHSGRGLR